ncbi:MAG: alkaline phosphatase family protein [Winogradskyella sp.]|uniref:alkaline phosphatase D family protein n=1 Tax=Winogradskyella sp. TaxID=1883156 RepID=UPI00184C0D8F|nr:alkaline phosphatase D family protein [Winogradskyella sp.]MBT8243755.1 alkaline phosphatase family protein [Winogradskyella sp.]NNK22052.1 alkaline phosphatase family protein [Winogradskyella sp.]
MKFISKAIFLAFLVFYNCGTKKENSRLNSTETDYTIAFGSCNKQDVKNELWDDILKQNPDLWIWGGDNIYADTDDMTVLKAEYTKQLNIPAYKKLVETTKILGTWDDHDYGLNDGGLEFKMKKESQQQFLDFMGVAQNDKRRNREGVYHAEEIKIAEGTIKVIVLDTRYFRSALVKDTESRKRYKPTTDNTSTVLGETQWQWLEDELNNSKGDFNIIVGSIQFLSMEHGFETWGNFPHEVERLKNIISDSNAKGVLLLSGDRHISEFSKINVDGLDYPLIDFTSSGLTHSYSSFTSESNKNRVGEVVSVKSYGLLKFNFKDHKIIMEMYANDNEKINQLIQEY